MTLRELIELWIASRDPRVADVIDRVGATIVVEPIKGKTLSAKVDAWIARAALADPDDVSMLVACSFPKGIRALERIVTAMIAMPEDPRVSRRLTELVVDLPIDSRAGREVIARAASRIATLRDVRALPRLKAISIHAYRLEQMRIPVTIGKLERVVVQRVADEVLAPFALPEPDHALDATLLAEVLAHPDDDAPRTVYGDYLVEHGDPRGELVVLQLAGDRGKRVRELVEKHGAIWATPMKRWFKNRRHWVFERGFFAGGRLDFAITAEDVASDPGWALVRVVSTVRLAMLGEWGAQLRELHLDVRDPDERDYARFPALKVLGIDGADAAPWCASTSVIDRLDRLVVRNATTEVLEALAARAGVRELELAGDADRFHDQIDWCVRITRATAPGPFTHVTATRAGGSREKSRALGDKLAPIPAGWVRELVATSRPIMLGDDEVASAETMLTRFTKATRIVVPWLRPTSVAPGRPVPFTLSASIVGERLERVWAVLTAFEQRYDTFSVNGSTTRRPLGKDPFTRLRTWHGGDNWLELRRGSADDYLFVSGHGTRGTLVVRDRAVAQVREVFFTLMDVSGSTYGWIGGPPLQLALDGLAHGIGGGWIVVVPPEIAAWLDRAEVAAIATTHPGLEGLRVLDHARLAIQLAATPEDVTQELLDQLRTALVRVLATARARHVGYDFRARARAVLDPVAARHGIPLVSERALDLRYYAPEGDRGIEVSLETGAFLVLVRHGGNDDRTGSPSPQSPAELEALLARAADGAERFLT